MTTTPTPTSDRHAHPAPADDELVDVRDMFVVHTALLREFRLLANAVADANPDHPRHRTALAGHLELLDDLLHHHHAGEDELLWPKLRERVPSAVATVDAVEDQHHQIEDLLHAARHARLQWTTAPCTASAHALGEALERLHQALGAHLDLEERELLPLAAAALTQAEWDAVGEAAVASMAKPALVLAFGMFSYEGDPAVLRRMLASAPLLPRLLLPRIAPRAYARRASRVYGNRRP